MNTIERNGRTFGWIIEPDDGNGPVPYDDESPVWWFEAYQIINPWEELARKGRVIFQRAA